jgi:hypothetical protein
MTNKSLRDYINLIESNEQGVAEGYPKHHDGRWEIIYWTDLK